MSTSPTLPDTCIRATRNADTRNVIPFDADRDRRRSEQEQDRRQARPERQREVVDRAGQRVRGREVAFGHHRRGQRGDGGVVGRGEGVVDERQGDHDGDRGVRGGCGDERHHAHHHGASEVGRDHDLPPVVAVRDRPAQGLEQDVGTQADHGRDPDPGRRAGGVEDVDDRRGRVEPVPRFGHGEARQQQPVIPVGQGSAEPPLALLPRHVELYLRSAAGCQALRRRSRFGSAVGAERCCRARLSDAPGRPGPPRTRPSSRCR